MVNSLIVQVDAKSAILLSHYDSKYHNQLYIRHPSLLMSRISFRLVELISIVSILIQLNLVPRVLFSTELEPQGMTLGNAFIAWFADHYPVFWDKNLCLNMFRSLASFSELKLSVLIVENNNMQ